MDDFTVKNDVTDTDDSIYKISTPPKPVGYWVLCDHPGYATYFAVFAKPLDEHIKNTEAILGWKWRDA